MSYSNPQRIINKEFDVRAKANRELQNTIQNTTASIAATVLKQKKQTIKFFHHFYRQKKKMVQIN